MADSQVRNWVDIPDDVDVPDGADAGRADVPADAEWAYAPKSANPSRAKRQRIQRSFGVKVTPEETEQSRRDGTAPKPHIPWPGVDQFFQGVQQLYTPGQVEQGASNAIRGLGLASWPAAIPALAAAPAITLAGAGVGMGVGALTEAMTGHPLAGDIAGLTAGGLTARGLGAITKDIPSIWDIGKGLLSSSEGRQLAYKTLPPVLRHVLPNPEDGAKFLDFLHGIKTEEPLKPGPAPAITPQWRTAGEEPLKPGPAPAITPQWRAAGDPDPTILDAPSITPKWNQAGGGEEPAPRILEAPKITPKWRTAGGDEEIPPPMSPLDTSQVPTKPSPFAALSPLRSPEDTPTILTQEEREGVMNKRANRQAKDDAIAEHLLQQGVKPEEIQPGQPYKDIVDGANKALGKKYAARINDADHLTRVQELKDALDRKWSMKIGQQEGPPPMNPLE